MEVARLVQSMTTTRNPLATREHTGFHSHGLNTCLSNDAGLVCAVSDLEVGNHSWFDWAHELLNSFARKCSVPNIHRLIVLAKSYLVTEQLCAMWKKSACSAKAL
jgi:hypothetical protein